MVSQGSTRYKGMSKEILSSYRRVFLGFNLDRTTCWPERKVMKRKWPQHTWNKMSDMRKWSPEWVMLAVVLSLWCLSGPCGAESDGEGEQYLRLWESLDLHERSQC